MKGCIVKKGKRYYIKYRFRGQQIWKAAGTRKVDAERMLVEIISKINNGQYFEPKKITFAEFAKKWLSEYAEGAVKPSTLESYEYIFRVHLIPFFGESELATITPEDVQTYVSLKRKEGKLSPKTINNTLVPLKEMFKHAVRWGYLRENPAAYVEKPRVPHKEMDFLTHEEVRLFLEHTPEEYYALFLTAIMTGMRRGELLAMKWGNLDWNRGQYFVKESLYRGSFIEPKSPKSRRAINLAPTLLETLRQHKLKQDVERLILGPDYQELDLIFCTKEGKPLDPDNLVKRVFHRILDAAGIRRIRFHDLRHTYASLLIAQGESPKYIQNQLGHASIQTTLDRYGHLMPDAHKEAAERLDKSLFGPTKLNHFIPSGRKMVEIPEKNRKISGSGPT
ncbi:MAG TPA: site-specific integrase [Thiotrichaceae bacterium]|nr:site-specific integrase [Thiotrichaceae bacterium]